MLLITFNVVYVLIALAMILLILLQRGSGAQAGSGFGAGASATVFGARGAGTFLTHSTAVLAGLFFVLSLGMGIYLSNGFGPKAPSDDLGVMSGTDVPVTPQTSPTAAPAGGDVPKAPSANPAATAVVPASGVGVTAAPAAVTTDATAAPAAAAPVAVAKPVAAPTAAPVVKKTDATDPKSGKPKNKQG